MGNRRPPLAALSFIPFIMYIIGCPVLAGPTNPKNIPPFANSTEWHAQEITRLQLLINNAVKKQTVVITQVPTNLKKLDFENELSKSFVKYETEAHTKNLSNFGFAPRNFDVHLESKFGRSVGAFTYEIPLATGSSTTVTRIFMGRDQLWQVSMIHEGRSALDIAEQSKLADLII